MTWGRGHRLSALKLFHEKDAGRHRHDTSGEVRGVLLGSGMWRLIRSRPFGRVPLPAEVPAAIFVAAQDTRPLAPDPRDALRDTAEDFARGLAALLQLTEGPVVVCQDQGAPLVPDGAGHERIKLVHSRSEHPWGLPGVQIHRLHPATTDRPVWDIHAEDVAGIGALLASGYVPETRLVSVAGPALKQARFVRCQPAPICGACAMDMKSPGRTASCQARRWTGPRRAGWASGIGR